ncbi:androgen-dependent TFPI-regulating protein-like [Vanessa atalanta]|uniref:androgen-dependent TFPI-regulating protein-like n=1 Tax=Vanessa atalanta TaxID=42275 RepID=UPI001FCDAFED|nr:androgen-dependent TFPI-regulating protein-like [Vanessa atalanta]
MIRSSDILLNVRLCYYGVAISHLVFAVIMIIPIDMSQDEDPRVSIYSRVRWKLITCWFNLMMLTYFPIAFYCDLKEKRGEWDTKRLRRLRKFRDYFMTSIIFPTTMYADFSFWILWVKDPELIAPMAVFKYLPYWAQHSLHTVSGVAVLMDILLLPRRRPTNVIPGLALMLAFCSVYGCVLAVSQFTGEPVYSLFELFGWLEVIMFVAITITVYMFFHFLQWYIVELIWGKTYEENNKNTLEKNKLN